MTKSNMTDNREIKPKNIKQLIVEIAEEPFVEDRVIGMIELVKEVKRQSRYKFEGKTVVGSKYSLPRFLPKQLQS